MRCQLLASLSSLLDSKLKAKIEYKREALLNVHNNLSSGKHAF